ncbi:MAG: DUF167 domain-containing protein [Planctomycetota bacterium]|jgi:uncharacterized protein (TIGR00251 family)
MDMTIQELGDGAIFTAKIVPGSSGQTRICGVLDGMLKIKVSAPPEKGKANQCLLRFVAHTLGVRKNAVSIIAGTTSPVKRVQVSGVSAETLLKKLNPKERSLR